MCAWDTISDEVFDSQFNEKLADKRHKELTGAMGKVISAVNQKEDKAVAEAIKENARATQGLVQVIKDIPKVETPQVNVDVNQKEVITSLEGICNKIIESNNKLIEAFNKRPVVEEFKLEKDNYGNTKTVKVIYKK